MVRGTKERRKENTYPKGGMGVRHAQFNSFGGGGRQRVIPPHGVRQQCASSSMARTIAVTVALFAALKLSIATNTTAAFTREEVVDFSEHHFKLYFTDCARFAGLFADNFEYCDALPCFSNKSTLIQACQLTMGSKSILHSITFMPARFPSLLEPAFDHIAIKGKQTTWIPNSPINEWTSSSERVPICCDFVILEMLTRAPKTDYNTHGMELTSWKGYYNMAPGICDDAKEDKKHAITATFAPARHKLVEETKARSPALFTLSMIGTVLGLVALVITLLKNMTALASQVLV